MKSLVPLFQRVCGIAFVCFFGSMAAAAATVSSLLSEHRFDEADRLYALTSATMSRDALSSTSWALGIAHRDGTGNYGAAKSYLRQAVEAAAPGADKIRALLDLGYLADAQDASDLAEQMCAQLVTTSATFTSPEQGEGISWLLEVGSGLRAKASLMSCALELSKKHESRLQFSAAAQAIIKNHSDPADTTSALLVSMNRALFLRNVLGQRENA